MGIKEAKAAAERLLKRHEDSFYTYATEGFVQTLANCLLDLPKERCEQALGTYPEELRKKIEEKLKKISETDWQSNPFRKRDETYVISQQDLITPEDYIALEDGLQDLNPEEYSEFYEEFEAKSKWLAEKANALRNKLAELGRLEYNQMQKLIQSLIFNESKLFYSVKTKEVSLEELTATDLVSYLKEYREYLEFKRIQEEHKEKQKSGISKDFLISNKIHKDVLFYRVISDEEKLTLILEQYSINRAMLEHEYPFTNHQITKTPLLLTSEFYDVKNDKYEMLKNQVYILPSRQIQKSKLMNF